MFDAGVESPLGELLASVRSVVAGVEVDELEAHEAARIVEECAEVERLLGALRVVAAATLEDKALWRRGGVQVRGAVDGVEDRHGPWSGEVEPPGKLSGLR